MHNMPRPHHLFAAVLLVAFFAMPICAIAQTDGMPEIMQQNNITYVTGGIGDDEKAALDAAKGNYNLHIINANPDGAYVSNVHLSIADKTGTEVFSSDAGPIFYAKIPNGRYSVTATHNDQTKKQNLTISSQTKASHINFVWKPATL